MSGNLMAEAGLVADEDLAHDMSTMELNRHQKTNDTPPWDYWFEAREIPNKGVGAVAIRTIPSGTRIICEAPLLALPEDADILELYQTISGLSPAEQKSFWSLAACTKVHKEVDWTLVLRSSYQDDDDGNYIDSFEALVEAHERALSTYETNRFTIRSSDGTVDKTGVFPNAARLNHSCTPNVFHRFNANIKRLTIHALRTIQPGEELHTSYIDILHRTVERRRILRHWGFECECNTCRTNDVNQDGRRKKLEQLMAQVKAREAQRGHETWSHSDYATALSTIEETIGLMEEEELFESDTLGEIYSNAAEYAVILGRREKAVEWAEKAAEVELKCCGEDSPEYEKASFLLRSVDVRVAVE